MRGWSVPYVPKGRPAERGCAGGGSSPSPPLWSSVTEEQTLLSGCSRAFSPVPRVRLTDSQLRNSRCAEACC
ncbi:hypothetical protein CgunFtcFv8_015944 [Champsocephalus gunnari]|uniref:Uncharacterized protein n=1 Tax=Champsocephalus gunnari TaxID=52237 RepID=A0AAN8H184_CHAGU|nr:hypothetical protein CgunFtcFv8_015944 [Champsocephalus gunnari]